MTNSLNSIIPAIQWHEGMLLAPQHFQQWDLRQQQLLHLHISHSHPFHWGVLRLEVDPVLLPTGIVRLNLCDAILPDGTLIQYDITKHPPLELDITSHQSLLEQEDWTLYLAMPQYVAGQPMTSGPHASFMSVEDEGTGDLNVTDNVIRIPRLIPKLQLILGQTPPARVNSIPLMKVAFNDESYYQRPYQPPCFRFAIDNTIHNRCQRLAQRIREKISSLSEKWQGQIGSALVQETAHLLRPLIQILPSFEGVTQTRQYHPFQLYQLLCGVVGQMGTLRLDQPPPVIPAYDHHQIANSLEPLLDYVENIFKDIERDISTIPFDMDGRFFFLELSPAYLKTDGLFIGVRCRGEMTEAELEDWMMGAIIACDSALETVKMRRVTGAERRLLKNQELVDILPGRSNLIFRIENAASFIHAYEKLNIFNMGDTPHKRPTDITLYLRADTGQPTSDEGD